MLNSKLILYFLLAALPATLQNADAPKTNWEWFKFVVTVLYQGLLAVKAFQSEPDEKNASQPSELQPKNKIYFTDEKKTTTTL